MSVQRERILPHSDDAEKSVLGAILVDKDVYFDVSEFISEEDFYSDAHKEIFSAIKDLQQNGENVDILTVSERLNKRGYLEAAGGRSYVALLSAVVPATSNAVQYAKVVAEKSVLRKLITASQRIAEDAFSEKLDSRDVLGDAERAILDISKKNQGGDYVRIGDVMKRNMDNIKEVEQRGDAVPGLSTGFFALDKLTTGLKKSDLIIIAARPSMGKTSLGLNIALNAATKSNARVVIFSLEMPDTGLGLRLLAQQARVDLKSLQTGDLDEDKWYNINTACEEISETDIIIDQSNSITVSEMRNKCRRIKAEKNIDLIVIDYMQLISSQGRVESRQIEMAQISRELKQLAREMDCPVIAMSQLSRSAEKRTGDNNRPMLSDLRDSGAIEQDADVVMFIYRDDYYKTADEVNDNLSEIIVAKNRNGETGTAKLTWLPQYTAFKNLAPGNMADQG